MPKLRIAAGDTVMVLAGKDKGKRGKVKLVKASIGKLEVEGVALEADAQEPEGRHLGERAADADQQGHVCVPEMQ
jgi:ribosomal protein L24